MGDISGERITITTGMGAWRGYKYNRKAEFIDNTKISMSTTAYNFTFYLPTNKAFWYRKYHKIKLC